MPLYLKNRLPLFFVLLIFIACKVPQLHYAYYWDESWPYAVAIKDMYHHGISLMPSAIDADLSRGHPLFFHAIAAAWMNIFGGSHVAMHSFALLISVLFLTAIYEAGIRLFEQRVAILALLLVGSQEMFFVQSSMVLFEVLVAFLCFLSLVFYVKDKYFLTALCLTMLFYTKESGLIMGFVLGLDAIMRLFNKKEPVKKRLSGLASIAAPCIMIVIYFLVQKHVRGWYIFPLYASLIQRNWEIFWYNFRINSIRSEFYDYFKFYYFLLLMLVAVIATFKQKKYWPLSILIPAICIYYLIDDWRAGRPMPSVPFFIFSISGFIYFLYQYSDKEYYAYVYQRKLIVLSGIFIMCFLCFSAMNFFTPRYLLASIVPAMFLTSIFFNTFINLTYKWLYYVIAPGILLISSFAYTQNENYGDCEIGAYDGIEVQQGVVDYLEKNAGCCDHIASGSFLESQHLLNPATGFLHSDKMFKDVKWDIDGKTQYVIFDNIENDSRRNNIKNDTNFRLAYRIEKGKVWGEVYKRK